MPTALTVALLGLTALATNQALQANHAREDVARDRAADEAADGISRRLLAYTEILHGVAGLFESSEEVTPAEFARFLTGQRMRERNPGVHVVSFAPARGSRLPLEYVEPMTTANMRALGFDLRSEARRRRTADRAALTDLPAATPPIRLVQETARQRSFIIFVPARRGERLLGMATAAFRMEDLIDAVLGRHTRAHVSIADAGTVSFGARLEGDTRTRRLPVGGRTWLLRHHAHGQLLSDVERATPWLLGVLGTVLAVLAGMLLRVLVTARARAVATAREMTSELQASKAELEHFTRLASHDLQEPLRTVAGFTRVLDQRLGDRLDEREREYMGHVTGGTQRMQELIEDLLRYVRSGRRGDPEQVDLGRAWDEAVCSLAAAIEESGATVTREKLPMVTGNRRELVSVMQNLIANALKYRSAAPPVVHASARRAGRFWEIAVRDNGQGIDRRFHERVFEIFQRLHTAEEAHGSGVGLAIVKKVARASGGDVRVESAVGAGSTFVVSLPAEAGR